MSNFAENVLISFIKIMFNLKLAKEYHSFIELDENDLNFWIKYVFYHFCELSRLYKSQARKAFGIELLKFFLNKLQYMVQKIRNLLEHGLNEQAMVLLDAVSQLPDNHAELCLEWSEKC